MVLPLLLGWVPDRSEVRGATPAVRPTYARAIQLVTALVFAVVTLRFGWSWMLPPVLALSTGLVAASAVDLACWRIPTRFVYLTAGATALGIAIALVAGTEPGSLRGAAIGSGIYLLLLGGLHLISPRLMGFGDVRLGFLIGAVVGWVAWTSDRPIEAPLGAAFSALIVTSLLASVGGVAVLLMRRRSQRISGRFWREPFPFGPWLCVGGLLAILL